MVNWTLYAAAIQEEFINMVKGDLRDSGSESLSPFWADPPEPGNDEVSERFAASVAFRVANDLLRISESNFVGQIIADKAQAFFRDFVDAMGIEREYVEDVFLEAPDSRIPEVPGLTDTIRILIAKGYEIDKDALEATFPSLDLSEEEVLHIDEPLPALFGEEDSVIAGKMANGQIYTRLYVEKNQSG
jgi:hypothetical protein